MQSDAGSVIIQAVGDVAVDRDDPASIFAAVNPVFQRAGILFGNCETTYSGRGGRNPIVRGGRRAAPGNAAALKDAGFKVMSFANNHCMDWGYDAFFDTMEILHGHGVSPVGAGKDLEEARKPVIVEAGGMRVAFLAYAPVCYQGYEAADNKPGCVPMRIYTVYRQVEHEQPGTDPEIVTVADPRHLQAMREDIRKARLLADLVAVSFHWGLHIVPVLVAMYETDVGRAAIDAGAGVVLGHHQHTIKGIQVYRGKVIFHGLGDFAVDRRADQPSRGDVRVITERYRDHAGSADRRKPLIAQLDVRQGQIAEVSYVPCAVNAQGQPVPCPPGSEELRQAAAYVESISRQAGFDTRFELLGDRVRVMTMSE